MVKVLLSSQVEGSFLIKVKSEEPRAQLTVLFLMRVLLWKALKNWKDPSVTLFRHFLAVRHYLELLCQIIQVTFEIPEMPGGSAWIVSPISGVPDVHCDSVREGDCGRATTMKKRVSREKL